MARKKETPKPMFAVKGDFVDSLDRALSKAQNLLAAVEMLAKLGAMDAEHFKILKATADELREALYGKDDEP